MGDVNEEIFAKEVVNNIQTGSGWNVNIYSAMKENAPQLAYQYGKLKNWGRVMEDVTNGINTKEHLESYKDIPLCVKKLEEIMLAREKQLEAGAVNLLNDIETEEEDV